MSARSKPQATNWLDCCKKSVKTKYYKDRARLKKGDKIVQDETRIIRVIVKANKASYYWKHEYSDEIFYSGNDSDPELRWGWQLEKPIASI